MSAPAPVIGDWYLDKDGELFEVIALDADDHTIEIQHFDGAVEEFDDEEWPSLLPKLAEAPEDWTGPMDVEPEDQDSPEAGAEIVRPTWLNESRLDRDEVGGFSEVAVN